MTLNLISGAWIPVRRRDGARAVIRPAQIVEDLSGNYVAFPDWPRPDLNIATLELLIGLFSVALPPEDDDEWLETWNKPPTIAELDKAFAPYESAFNLDGEGPRFCQDFDALEGDVQNIEALFIDDGGLKAGDNTDLFVKRGRYPFLSPAASAIALYALQQFAPSGGRGHRTSLRGGGPMTTLALPPTFGDRPPSLWQLIWANVPEAENGPLGANDMPKAFPWLIPTMTSEKGDELHQSDQTHAHPLQCFFGMPRRIRLQFDKSSDHRLCNLTNKNDETTVTGYITRPYGINYGQWRHPLTPYRRKKEAKQEHFATHPTAGLFGYRNWLAIVLGNQEKTHLPAATITKFKERLRGMPSRSGAASPLILIAGWAMSNMKPLDFILAEQPLYVLADQQAQEKFDEFARNMVLAAQSASKSMIGAIQEALKAGGNKPSGDSALLTSARESFFADTETNFHQILGRAAAKAVANDDWQQPFAKHWLKHLQHAAFNGFDATSQPPPNDPDRARQVVEARKKLTSYILFAKGAKSLRGILKLPIPTASKPSKKGTMS